MSDIYRLNAQVESGLPLRGGGGSYDQCGLWFFFMVSITTNEKIKDPCMGNEKPFFSGGKYL